MRVTRDSELHERPLRRRYRYRLEVVGVQSPSAELRAVQDRITADELETVELAEHANRVEVGIVQRTPFFGGADDALFGRTRVQLSRPLGDRRVIDAATGREP